MEKATDYRDGISLPSAVLQAFLMSLVVYLWASPVILPIKIMVVLFHEMSHGLMALLSGGKVISISITGEEGGSCETEGGIPALIVSAGYLGSMFFGGLLLYLSKYRGCVPVVYTFLTLTLAAAIFTVLHDPFPRTFATAIAGSFIFLGLVAPTFIGALVLRILGTVSCLYSILDIYWDVLATERPGFTIENDAVAFAALTGIPAQVVGVAWLAVSLIYFLSIIKIIVREDRPAAAMEGDAAPARA